MQRELATERFSTASERASEQTAAEYLVMSARGPWLATPADEVRAGLLEPLTTE